MDANTGPIQGDSIRSHSVRPIHRRIESRDRGEPGGDSERRRDEDDDEGEKEPRREGDEPKRPPADGDVGTQLDVTG